MRGHLEECILSGNNIVRYANRKDASYQVATRNCESLPKLEKSILPYSHTPQTNATSHSHTRTHTHTYTRTHAGDLSLRASMTPNEEAPRTPDSAKGTQQQAQQVEAPTPPPISSGLPFGEWALVRLKKPMPWCAPAPFFSCAAKCARAASLPWCGCILGLWLCMWVCVYLFLCYARTYMSLCTYMNERMHTHMCKSIA